MTCAALRIALEAFARFRARSGIRVLTVAASAWAVALAANADHFSYRDDHQCAHTPDAEAAIEACTRLYENGSLGPRNRAIALGNRGVALKFLGRYDRAIGDFTAAIGLDPRNPRYFCQRGDALRTKRAFKDAIADYTAALSRAPGSLCAYHGRAQAYLAQGNTQQALAEVATGLRTKPASLQLLVLRGRANKQAKLYDAAIADFSQALTSKSQSSLRPDDRATIRSERAFVLLKLDRPVDAKADVDEALRIAPENASAIATMGSIDEQLGHKPEAIASYSRALAIKPDLEDAKRGLERLTLREATALSAPPATPQPRLETEDNKRAPERLALPAAIPPPPPTTVLKSERGTSVSVRLYKIISLVSGEHRTSTSEFSNLAQCQAAVELFRSHAPLGDKTLLYCIKHALPALPAR
jgi:tetratricopeptide (TPR) repeat protein